MATPAPDPIQQQKFSRYRSARQNAAAKSATSYAPPPTSFSQPAEPLDTIQRSRSRYRRGATNGAPHAPLPHNAAQIASKTVVAPTQVSSHMPKPLKTQARTQVRQAEPSAPPPPPHASSPRALANGALPMRTKTSRDAMRARDDVDPSDLERREAGKHTEKEADRQRRLKEQLAAQGEREKAHRQQRATEQKKQDVRQPPMSRQLTAEEDQQAKREAQNTIAQQRQALARNRHQREGEGDSTNGAGKSDSWEKKPDLPSSNRPEPAIKSSSSREFFGIFKRKRGEAIPAPDSPSAQQKFERSHPRRNPSQDAPLPPTPAHGMDAPISAVNAGGRQVLIEANGTTTLQSVTPSTTPVDLLRAASTTLGNGVRPQTSVLMEKFGKVGIQRPLRKYEHVRDVLNSWDDDRQNSLVVVPSAMGGQDTELEAASVPTAQPNEFACQLSYSQRPGKWDKRWITLRQDGQVTVAKKEGMKMTDQTNVCHLSDFDIYTPAPKQLARKIKPPKKHCFAIKSQQKSNLFESLESFVHFFCSNDKQTAASFYSAVQGWRSWYLVNVLGEGQKTTDAKGRTSGLQQLSDATQPLIANTSHHGRVASNESNFQNGPFKPLIDLDSVDTAKDNTPADATVVRSRSRSVSGSQGQGQGFSFNTTRNRTSGSRGAAPPSAFPSTLPNGATQPPRDHSNSNSSTDAAFAPTGLLGRTYSKRQAEAQARDNDRNVPFTNGHSLVHTSSNPRDAPAKKSIDHERLHTSSDPTLKRSSSQRKPNRPLVDLTPQYREPPQFANKGKGFHPDAIGQYGLVDSATSPEDAINAPQSQDWQNRSRVNGTVKRPTTAGQSEGDRAMSLAQTQHKSVKGKTGGTRVEDMWQKNAGPGFEAGSLLDKVQREGKEHYSEGPAGMRWDRSRHEERTVAYGEAA